MIRGVYHFDPQDSSAEQHPCVVVLDIAGSKEYIIVPAYSVGRQIVEDAITLHITPPGLPRDAVVVTLNNALALNPPLELALTAPGTSQCPSPLDAQCLLAGAWRTPPRHPATYGVQPDADMPRQFILPPFLRRAF